MTNDDPMLTADQVGARVKPPISGADFRSRVAHGKAPKPDDPDDANGRPANRRQPRWLASTADAWDKTRTTVGRPPIAGMVDGTPFEIRKLSHGSFRHRYAVIESNSGRVIDRFRTATDAKKYLTKALDIESSED